MAVDTFAQLQLVHQLPETKDLVVVPHAFVTTRLDYCNVLYIGIQLLQNSLNLVVLYAF